MKPLSSLSYLRLTMFAKPVCDRLIYKLIRRNKFRSILEIGMEDGTRSENMIRIAKKYGVSPNVRYTGIDQFEGRVKGQNKLQLIEMHRKLHGLDAKTQLVPGDVQSAISRIANAHVRTDLIVISGGQFENAKLDLSWFYFPRMLHSSSLVLIQNAPGQEFQQLKRLEIEKLAAQQTPKRAVAA